MGLREIAENDLGLILENEDDFGWLISLTSPDGETKSFIGLSDDISQVIDPDTGIAVSGRLASIALRISSIYKQGFTLPKAIADTGSKPWIVEFDDINGNTHTFKIQQSNPDRALGILTCILESYKK